MILQQMPAKLEDIKRADSPRPPSLSLAQLHGTEGGAKAGMARRGTSTLHVGLQQRSDTSLGRPGLVLYEGAAPLTIHLRSLYGKEVRADRSSTLQGHLPVLVPETTWLLR